MKVRFVLVFVLPFMVLGCKRQQQSVQSQTPPQGVVVSDVNGTAGVATVTDIVKDGTNTIPATAIITGIRKEGGRKP